MRGSGGGSSCIKNSNTTGSGKEKRYFTPVGTNLFHFDLFLRNAGR